MPWTLILPLMTFAVLVAFLLWNRYSTKRNHETPGLPHPRARPLPPRGAAGPADAR